MTPAQLAEKKVPKLIIFGGKAAPGYAMAKQTIRLINCVGNVVNNDPSIKGLLKVVFVPNYNVSLAQIIIPATDVSEQISTAGYEASGTSCMKFCMNGGLLIGTWDGANIEIMAEIGQEQAYMFGLKAHEVPNARAQRQSPTFVMDPRLDEALKAIESGMFGNPEDFAPFTNSIRNNDNYLVACDFPAYVDLHRRIETDWKDKEAWGHKAILTSIRMDKFSSDRSIIDYSEKIWGIRPCKVPAPIQESQMTK